MNEELLKMRKTVKITVNSYWDECEEIEYPIITKQEFSIFPPRFIFSQKPIGLSSKQDKYITVTTPISVPKNCGFKPGVYAILTKDFQELINSLPHFPNKKESRKLRQNASKIKP